MAAPSPARRRQRSVRVTVAVTLLGVATAVVLAALPTQDALVLSGAAVLGLVLGWAALRMMWTEVLQSRREHAADRAAAASAYRNLFSQRAAEHAEFTTAMTERLAESQMSMRELEAELAVERRRAGTAETRLQTQSTRLTHTQKRVRALETELARRQADEADALAVWEAGGQDDGVADLASFEGKAGVAGEKRTATRSA
ncbi:MAG: hypothetical protein ACRDPH_03745 [Marmoricola sp.]